MRDEPVAVSFDERRGYVATAPELRAPVVALCLGGLQRLMLPDDPIVVLRLDRAARREHDQRRLAVAFASHTPHGRVRPRELPASSVAPAPVSRAGEGAQSLACAAHPEA
jgi:hypothetical protein